MFLGNMKSTGMWQTPRVDLPKKSIPPLPEGSRGTHTTAQEVPLAENQK
jgi:hypothetical protein